MTPAFFILFFWMLSTLSGKDVQRKKYQTPKISIKPHRAVSLGDNVSISCEGPWFSSLCFYLEKDGQEISSEKGIGKADFPITNANREHGGIYICYYKDLKSQSKSQRSKPVELLLRDPALPRPSMVFYPRRMAVLGERISIFCTVTGPSRRFFLHTGEDEKPAEPNKNVAIFDIGNIDWDDGKNYQCSYSSQSGFFISEPSNPMELLIVDPKFPRPSISLSPMDGVTVGRNVTIDCRSQDTPKNFYLLRKYSHQTTDIPMQTEGTVGKFLISNASLDHRGNYSCSYHPKSEPFSVSEPSDPVELLITDPDLLRPTISMRPTGIARLRSNVTVYCSTNGTFVMFRLYKSGDPMTSQPMETDGDMAMFSINNVGVKDSGDYYCCYRPTSESFFISKPSNHVKLLVLDPSLPRPKISIISSGLPALGGQVKIQCETEIGPARFFLYKDGDPTLKWPMKTDSEWDVGELTFSNISWEYQGNYSCNYALESRLSVFSAHSDPMELLVSEPPEPPDYTGINILRFAIGALTLLFLAYIVIGDHHFWKEQYTQSEAIPSSSITGSLSFPNKK